MGLSPQDALRACVGTIPFSARLITATFDGLVAGIIRVRPEEQMGRVTTRRIVALVAHADYVISIAIWNLTIC